MVLRENKKCVRMLPKTLAGIVCQQWVRCGRTRCRCGRGELHGPYHYRFWREGGRLRKAYVRPAELEQVRGSARPAGRAGKSWPTGARSGGGWRPRSGRSSSNQRRSRVREKPGVRVAGPRDGGRPTGTGGVLQARISPLDAGGHGPGREVNAARGKEERRPPLSAVHGFLVRPRQPAQADPEKFVQRWEEIKLAAREELLTGHRACQPVEVYGSTPWTRARFLALRLELADVWQPRTGVERQLVDIMAQARTAKEHWLKTLMSKAALLEAMEQAALRNTGGWEPPRATGFPGRRAGRGDGGPLQPDFPAYAPRPARPSEGFSARRRAERRAGERGAAAGERGAVGRRPPPCERSRRGFWPCPSIEYFVPSDPVALGSDTSCMISTVQRVTAQWNPTAPWTTSGWSAIRSTPARSLAASPTR